MRRRKTAASRVLPGAWLATLRRFLYSLVLAGALFVALPSDAGVLNCHEIFRTCVPGSCSSLFPENQTLLMVSNCCWIDAESGLIPRCYRLVNTLCTPWCDLWDM